MGSSNKKKKEKQQDFKKTKLKVGKAKVKPANFTDTSFKSKAIAVAHQSLSETAPDVVQKFKHHLSLAASSNSDRQRKDALAFLTSQLSAGPDSNPVGTRELLVKLLPSVHAEEALRWIRVGMTHLSTDVSLDALSVLEWLLEVASDEAVACPGGWVMTLNSFCAMMGWSASGNRGWTSAPKIGVRTKDAACHAQQLTILAKFLKAGLRPEAVVKVHPGQYWDGLYRINRSREPFAHLNIYGARRDGDGEMYQDRESRNRAFQKRYAALVLAGAEQAKREAGAPGRASATLMQVLRDSTGDSEGEGVLDADDLLHLW
ncbi:unnamed protein product [Parascedosporium putredinis]|uniref:Pre-rRNA-processing protein n=1 Tax=Parascedosporium putredinis TaxID=1442378 RepID=A0A9P1GVP6_9PEZI|nr:unnamed protein product [Parascedosporium putredinis]CAI7988191.1 unnamed protein product [Parascedosporium putredinis]